MQNKGDVLVTGLQSRGANTKKYGIDIWNVTEPHHPERLATFDFRTDLLGHPTQFAGCHELEVLVKNINNENKVYALCGMISLEAASKILSPANLVGGLVIIDITDPRNPTFAADWSLERDAGIAIGFGLGRGTGGFNVVANHSVSVNKRGDRAYLSYFDGGSVILDIFNLQQIKMISRVDSGNPEGNAHSTIVSPNQKTMVVTHKVFTPSPSSNLLGNTEIYDISNELAPVLLSSYATTTFNPGNLDRPTVHNPVIRGDKLYLSNYQLGIRKVDISNPSNPIEIAAWVPGMAPNSGILTCWGVAVHGDKVYASCAARNSQNEVRSWLVILKDLTSDN